MTHLKAFAAGFLATVTFHQGFIGLLYAAGAISFAPFSMASTPPLGIPAVISLAFWGGVWGVVLWPLIKRASGGAYWLRCAVFGAIGPASVALFVVMPLKGLPVAAGWNPKIIIGALLVNAIWGLGLGVFMRGLRKL